MTSLAHIARPAETGEKLRVIIYLKEQPTTRQIMDEYKASVQGVDDALARLNATLASYKLSGNLPKKPVADPEAKIQTEPASLGDTPQVPEEARGTLKHHVFQVVSKVVSEPVDWESWNSLSDAEALQKYPEVCSFLVDNLISIGTSCLHAAV